VARIVVFGYGNLLRGDDAAGWRVAEAVGERWTRRVLVRTAQQPVPEWAADLRDADLACFVDASVAAFAPELRPVSPQVEAPPIDSHDLDPEQLLRLTRAVYGRAPHAFVLHVPGHRFDYSEELSPIATRGVQEAVYLLNVRIGAALSDSQDD
jgi:hydrogenase maturation protease